MSPLTLFKVTKINWKSGGIPLTASGVEFAPASSGSTRYTASARREVIIAAGAIQVKISSQSRDFYQPPLPRQSPALLQLSGIGDSAVLGPLGITTRIDLKTVGKNLQEQVSNHLIIPLSSMLILSYPTPIDDEHPRRRRQRI